MEEPTGMSCKPMFDISWDAPNAPRDRARDGLPMMNIIVANAKGVAEVIFILDLVRKSTSRPRAWRPSQPTTPAWHCADVHPHGRSGRDGGMGRRCLVTERKPRAGRWWAGLTFLESGRMVMHGSSG